MGNYTNSDFVKNKYSKDIVYLTLTGVVKVNVKDFLKENAHLTIQDFNEMKRISDSIYQNIDKSDNNYFKHKVSLDELNDCILFRLCEITNNESTSNIFSICLNTNILTEVEKRRLMLYFFYELNYEKISNLENVTPQAISKSIKSALDKLKNHLKF